MLTADLLRPFQRRFVKAVENPHYRRLALTTARGNGKSALSAYLITRSLTPGDVLFHAGDESVLFSRSFEQCRIIFKFVRRALDADADYRFLDSGNRIGVTHLPSNTRVRAIGSSGKTAMGLGADTVLAILDEPGALDVAGGELLSDAIDTSLGKPGSNMRAIYVGTLAPAGPKNWWPQLVKRGTRGRTYVQALVGDPKKWDYWPEIRKVNPLVNIDAGMREELLEERDDARRDSRLHARFCSYRLNTPERDESKVVLTTADWDAVCERPVPERDGKPIVGIDLGQGRAWSAAVAVWPNLRTEAFAVAPGIPDLSQQERRDRVDRGEYTELHDAGLLEMAKGLHIPPASQIVERVMEWQPSMLISDRNRFPELLDAVGGRVPVIPRITRWFSAAEDIRAIRKLAKDGGLACEPKSRAIIEASLAVSEVKSDDQGNTRMVKMDECNNCGRDDIVAALTLAAGQHARTAARPKRTHVVC